MHQEYGKDNIIVKPTKKKEVNLYLLKGYEQQQAADEQPAFLSTALPGDALGEFLAQAPWDLGGRVNAHAGKLQLPANLAAYSKWVPGRMYTHISMRVVRLSFRLRKARASIKEAR